MAAQYAMPSLCGSAEATPSGLLWFATVTACQVAGPQYGPDRSPGQRGLLLPGFQRVGRPSRLLDMTTTASGLLCWRDFHPQEWQLASPHWSARDRARA